MKKTISAGLSVIILTLAFVSLLVAKEQGKEPKDIILDTIEESLRVLKDPSMRGKENISKCRETLWTFLEPIFDLEAISKRALGRAWLKCSVEQRKEFTKVFAEILKDVYLDKSVCCGGEKIVLVRENKQEKRSKVETNFITKENEEISVDFSMYKKDNDWKIYDVTIEGVSIAGNYRSQFNSILSNSSFEEFIKKLKEKKKDLIEPSK